MKIDSSFQHFEEEMQELKTMYALTGTGIILCKKGNDYFVFAAIRKINNKTGKL